MGSAPYPVQSKDEGLVVNGGLVILGTSGSAATVVSDPDKLLDATTPITYTSAGVNVLNLREDWSYIGGSVNVQGIVGDMGYLTSPVYTKGANTITLVTWDESATAVADIAVNSNVDLILKR